jgi:flagellar biosynthetic protein FlhB
LQFGLVVAPLAALSAIVVFGATAAQGGWVFSGEPLKLRWENLSPATGLKRLAPSRALVELGKTVLTAAAVAWICWGFARDLLAEADPMARMSALDAARVGWDATARMLARCAILLVLVAGADFLYQRWRFEQNLRMTKQEVRDDHRLSEGNPETKARVRRIQRELVRRRMLAAVPKATVVITNPDHFAVALEYRREVMLAPRVVAKGQDFLAEKIKAIAREHGVPVVENKPLARALYRSVDVGDTIPGDLFEAVAEVLAYLVRLKQVVL